MMDCAHDPARFEEAGFTNRITLKKHLLKDIRSLRCFCEKFLSMLMILMLFAAMAGCGAGHSGEGGPRY